MALGALGEVLKQEGGAAASVDVLFKEASKQGGTVWTLSAAPCPSSQHQACFSVLLSGSC